MKRKTLFFLALIAGLFFSCEKDKSTTPVDETPTYDFPVPDTYDFSRNSQSTVNLTEPGYHISMCMELLDVLYDYEHSTLEGIMNMWNNENDPFSDSELNNYEGSIRDAVAASADLYDGGNDISEEIRNTLEQWMRIWVDSVFPYTSQLAAPGIAGQARDDEDVRFVDPDGMEYLQVVSKSLDGALMMDQIVNNWLSNSILEDVDKRADNDNEVLVNGKNYTALEYAWDQAYGYIYSLSKDYRDPMATMGLDDLFLNKYVKLIDNDDDFEGIALDIFNAFRVGRAALVAGDYEEMKKQADIVKDKVSNIMIIRTAFYLQSGVNEQEKDPPEMGAYLHDTGEGWGFVYSLQFAKNPVTDAPYFSRERALEFQDRILSDGPHGLWGTKMQTLRDISNEIAAEMPWEAEDAKDF